MSTTSKPIGTISYNTPNFLMKTIYYLRDNGFIDDYRIILHYGEEENKKDHFHLLLYPARRLDPARIQKLFDEPDFQNPDKPLSVLPFRYSEPLNWLLYALHDREYLSTHQKQSGGDGKIEYDISEVVAGCREYLEQDFHRAYAVRTSPIQAAFRLALQGYSFVEILAEVPNINPSALRSLLAGVASSPGHGGRTSLAPTLESASAPQGASD